MDKTPKTWSVIKFPNEGSVSAVPTSWVCNDTCFWPPYTKKSAVAAAIERHDPPDFENWDVFPCASFRNNVYETFSEANKKCTLATKNSDLDSQSESGHQYSSKKRKIFKKTYSFSSGEEEVESELPSPPQVKKLKAISRQDDNLYSSCSSSQVNRLKGISRQQVDNSLSSCREIQNVTSEVLTDNLENLEFIEIGMLESTEQFKEGEGAILSSRKSKPETRPPVDAVVAPTKKALLVESDVTTIIKYLQQILKKQNILQSIMMDMSNRILELENNQTRPVAENDVDTRNSIFTNLPNLPVETKPQLAELEEYLSNQQQMENAIKEISQIGGTTIYEFIARSATQLITDQFCGRSFSFLGRRQKEAFRVLKLNELLLKAAMRIHKTTEKEVEINISKWLRRCLDRGKQHPN